MNSKNLFNTVVSLFGRFDRYICSFVAPTPTRVGEYNLFGRFNRYICSFVDPTPRVEDYNDINCSVRVFGPLGKWKLEKKIRKLQLLLTTQISAIGNDPEMATLKDHLNLHLQKLHQAQKKTEMKATYKETKNCWCRLEHYPEMPRKTTPAPLEEPLLFSSCEESLTETTRERHPIGGMFDDEFEEKINFKKKDTKHPEASKERQDLEYETQESCKMYHFEKEAEASAERLEFQKNTVDRTRQELDTFGKEKDALEMDKKALAKEKEVFYEEREDLRRQGIKFQRDADELQEMLCECNVAKIRLEERQQEMMKAEEDFLIRKEALERERVAFEKEKEKAKDEERAALSREWQAVGNAKNELHQEKQKLQEERAAFNKEKEAFDMNAKDSLTGKEEQDDKREAQNCTAGPVNRFRPERTCGDGFLEAFKEKMNANFNDTMNSWEKNLREKMRLRKQMQLDILRKEKESLLMSETQKRKEHEDTVDRLREMNEKHKELIENLEKEKVSLLNEVEHLKKENYSFAQEVQNLKKDHENADRNQESITHVQEEELELLRKENSSLRDKVETMQKEVKVFREQLLDVVKELANEQEDESEVEYTDEEQWVSDLEIENMTGETETELSTNKEQRVICLDSEPPTPLEMTYDDDRVSLPREEIESFANARVIQEPVVDETEL
ncbi:trichohyalin-like [Macrobrachium rosenbergii]|uniref:trichohyalin-like n=1 Tax=Macrobrachium rosenbergii TaxID=79674 RepID=UPI0034D78109